MTRGVDRCYNAYVQALIGTYPRRVTIYSARAKRPSIDFIFTIARIESIADGSPKITLSLIEENIPEAAML